MTRPNSKSKNWLVDGEMQLLPDVDRLFALAGSAPSTQYDPSTGLPVAVGDGKIAYNGIAVVFDVDDARAAFTDAQTRWSTAGITNYTITYGFGCSCPLNGRWTSEVIGGSLASQTIEDRIPGTSVDVGPGTVEELFDVIADAMDRPPDIFTLEFADEGYPVRFSFDMVTSIDEEFGFGQVTVTPTP